jgi:hypothetical protein
VPQALCDVLPHLAPLNAKSGLHYDSFLAAHKINHCSVGALLDFLLCLLPGMSRENLRLSLQADMDVVAYIQPQLSTGGVWSWSV